MLTDKIKADLLAAKDTGSWELGAYGEIFILNKVIYDSKSLTYPEFVEIKNYLIKGRAL
jgi:hypothetical protein